MNKFKKDDYKVPVFSWCEDIEDKTMVQVDNLARLPFVAKHIALMPDAHMGYGMPIGGVMALKNTVSCNAVGYDIACGVCAIKTNIQEIPKDDLKSIFSKIRKVVPVGLGKHHKEMQDAEFMPAFIQSFITSLPICNQQYDSARKQIGTLGSGK